MKKIGLLTLMAFFSSIHAMACSGTCEVSYGDTNPRVTKSYTELRTVYGESLYAIQAQCSRFCSGSSYYWTYYGCHITAHDCR